MGDAEIYYIERVELHNFTGYFRHFSVNDGL